MKSNIWSEYQNWKTLHWDKHHSIMDMKDGTWTYAIRSFLFFLLNMHIVTPLSQAVIVKYNSWNWLGITIAGLD